MWDELLPSPSLLILDGRRVEQACRWTAPTIEGICNSQMCPEQLVRGQPAEASLLGTHRDPPT